MRCFKKDYLDRATMEMKDQVRTVEYLFDYVLEKTKPLLIEQ